MPDFSSDTSIEEFGIQTNTSNSRDLTDQLDHSSNSSNSFNFNHSSNTITNTQLINYVRSADLAQVKNILQSGNSFNIHERSADSQNTLIHYACVGFNFIDGPNIELIKLLLENGADPNSENRVMETPLHCAAKFGTVEICNLLLRFGADKNKKNIIGQLPMDMTFNPEVKTLLNPN